MLTPLTIDHIREILNRADAVVSEEHGLERVVCQDILEYLADLSDGDGIGLS